MNFYDIQSSCENKGSEEMEPQPLPNHTGLCQKKKKTCIIQMSTFQDFLRRLMYNCIDDDGDQPLLK